jgi:hypothetical protein
VRSNLLKRAIESSHSDMRSQRTSNREDRTRAGHARRKLPQTSNRFNARGSIAGITYRLRASLKSGATDSMISSNTGTWDNGKDGRSDR